MVTVHTPWTVVGGDDDQCVVIDPFGTQGIDNLSYGPVQFHDDVPVEPSFRPSFELV